MTSWGVKESICLVFLAQWLGNKEVEAAWPYILTGDCFVDVFHSLFCVNLSWLAGQSDVKPPPG